MRQNLMFIIVGSALCLDCRPKINEAKPPELTYGGKRIRPTTQQQQQQQADDATTACNLAADSSKKIAVGLGDDECSDRISNFEDGSGAEIINDDERIDVSMEFAPESTKKRSLSITTLVTSADGCTNSNTDSPLLPPTQHTECYDSDSGKLHRSSSHANANRDKPEMQEGEVHVAKKQKVEEQDPSWGDEDAHSNIIHSGIDGATKEVSIESTDENNHSIQQDRGVEEMSAGVNDTTNPPEDENDDDDSDIVWLGTSPSKVPEFDYGTDDDDFYAMANSDVQTAATLGKSEFNAHYKEEIASNDVHGAEFAESHFEHVSVDKTMLDICGSSRDHTSDADLKSQLDLTTTMQLLPSPKKDVCYICGSDLSRLKSGLRGRIAHMKRCSAKNKDLAFGGCTARSSHEDSVDEVESIDANNEEEVPIQNIECGANNPYNNGQWHNDSESDLKLNKSTFSSQPKQTVLKDFFKAPVKCLTSVLMAGARQVAKSEASIKVALASPPKVGKESNTNSRWGSNNRRNGSCPSYKRIPGTDFICDGFQFATRTLSENYFLTHFHSDVSYFTLIRYVLDSF